MVNVVGYDAQHDSTFEQCYDCRSHLRYVYRLLMAGRRGAVVLYGQKAHRTPSFDLRAIERAHDLEMESHFLCRESPRHQYRLNRDGNAGMNVTEGVGFVESWPIRMVYVCQVLHALPIFRRYVVTMFLVRVAELTLQDHLAPQAVILRYQSTILCFAPRTVRQLATRPYRTGVARIGNLVLCRAPTRRETRFIRKTQCSETS